MPEQEFDTRICVPYKDEFGIYLKLRSAMPSFTWADSDASTDKIRVIGTRSDSWIGVYRREDETALTLTVHVRAPDGVDPEREYRALRDQVLMALGGQAWPVGPQPVALIEENGRFPAAYDFACDLDIFHIASFLNHCELTTGRWDVRRFSPTGVYLEGQVYFVCPIGAADIRLDGKDHHYTITVGDWPEVHRMVQITIFPALRARNVRASAST